MTGEARIGAGFRYVYVGRSDSNGYLSGNIDSAVSRGSLLRMSRLRGAQTFPVQVPDRDRVPVSGDDEPLVTFSFASEELPNGVLAMAVRDLDFDALAQGTLAQNIGDLKAGALAPSGQANQALMFLLMREAKKYEGSTKGVTAWECLLIPSCEVTPLGAEWQQRTFTPYNYGLTVSKAARAIYGATYTEFARGTSEMALEPIDADNPIEIYAGLGDNATTSFSLSNPPVSADANKTHCYVNGIKLIYGSGAGKYTVSGSTLIFGTAPSTDAQIQYMQEVSASVLS